ncbi:MAG: hypothetical protein HKN39_02450 [Flavobacteriales bacterium]|nr:hypothetical protein [Flavobacteriales bacterium]
MQTIKAMNEEKVTLSIYPNAFGLAYVISESPKEIIDYGMKQIKKKDVPHFLKMFDKILEYFQPHVVILRDYNNPNSHLSEKYKQIWNAIEKRVLEKGLKLFQYSREQIKSVFVEFNAETKHQISEIIVKWYPQLKSRSPRKRKPWLNEDNQMGIFDAFSLTLTHAYFEE